MEQVTIFALLVFYKITCLVVGLVFAYMGYRLFLEDKTKPAGSLVAGGGSNVIKLTNAAPGIFFSLFGTVLIVFSVLKGFSFSHDAIVNGSSKESVSRVIPDKPPF